MAMKLAVGDKQRALEHLRENLPDGKDITFVELQSGDDWASYKVLIACIDEDFRTAYIKDITQDFALVMSYKLSSSKRFLTGVCFSGGVDYACMVLHDKLFPEPTERRFYAKYWTGTGGEL